MLLDAALAHSSRPSPYAVVPVQIPTCSYCFGENTRGKKREQLSSGKPTETRFELGNGQKRLHRLTTSFPGAHRCTGRGLDQLTATPTDALYLMEHVDEDDDDGGF